MEDALDADADKEMGRVGLLGVGLMGSAMGYRLLDQGIGVVAWDHTPDHIDVLEKRGAGGAAGPAEVVRGTDVVITMLPTSAIVLDIVEPLLEDWPESTIWLQMSSIGAAEADQLLDVARTHDVTLVDAPVSGSTHPAEEGQLTILASGPDSARAAVEPVFEALGSRVLWVGQAGMGSRLKMAANHWMIAMTAALAESMHLCQAMGLDQQQFVDLLDGGPLGSAYGLMKLGEMRAHDYPAGFPVRLALKDLELVREVEQHSKTAMPLLDVVRERFLAANRDHADEDLAAVYEVGRSG
jgi:3-hydroxyisobutyrate dehydrogenase